MDTLNRSPFPPSFYLSLLVTLLLFFGMHALMPTLPLYVVHLGGTAADNGLVQWAFALASVLFRPLGGALADRWGDRPVLLVGTLLFGGAPLLYSFCPSLPPLLVARALHGIGLALYTTAYRALATELSPGSRRGEALGLIGTASSATMAVAPLAGEALVKAGDFGLLFGLLGGLGLAAFGISFLLPESRHPGEGETSPSLRRALQKREIRRGAAAMAFLGIPYGALIGFLALLAEARNLGTVGLAYTGYALTVVAGAPLSGRLSDRWGRRSVVLPGALLVALAAGGLALADSRWALLALTAVFGLGWGILRTGLDSLVQDSAGSSLRASATAAQYTAFDLAIGLGSLGLGALAGATGYGSMFGLGALAAIAAALMVW